MYGPAGTGDRRARGGRTGPPGTARPAPRTCGSHIASGGAERAAEQQHRRVGRAVDGRCSRAVTPPLPVGGQGAVDERAGRPEPAVGSSASSTSARTGGPGSRGRRAAPPASTAGGGAGARSCATPRPTAAPAGGDGLGEHSPPVASRFARIRSGRTCSPASIRAHGRRRRRPGAAGRAAAPTRRASPGGALVLLHGRGEQRGDEARARGGRGADQDEPTGLRLCGMADEPPGRSPPSATSPISVWASSATSSATLPSAPRASAERGGQVGDRAAVGVPGQRGLGAGRAARRRAATTAGRPSPSAARVPTAPPSCSGQPATRALAQPVAGLVQRRSASRRPSARTSVGHRLLQQRPAGHAGVPVASRRAGRRRRRPRRGRRAAAPSARPATSISAVSMMSWLVAPRCTHGRAGSGTARGQLPHERDDRVAGGVGGPAERRRVVRARRGTRSTIAVGRRRRAAARRAACPGERGLRVEHRPQPGAGRSSSRGRRPGAGQRRRAGRQTAKKTVSWSPCRWMSKR